MNLDRLNERVKALELLASTSAAQSPQALTDEAAIQRVRLIMALVARFSEIEDDLLELVGIRFDHLRVSSDQIEHARYCAGTLAQLFLRSEWRRLRGEELTIGTVPAKQDWPEQPIVRDLTGLTAPERRLVFQLINAEERTS